MQKKVLKQRQQEQIVEMQSSMAPLEEWLKLPDLALCNNIIHNCLFYGNQRYNQKLLRAVNGGGDSSGSSGNVTYFWYSNFTQIDVLLQSNNMPLRDVPLPNYDTRYKTNQAYPNHIINEVKRKCTTQVNRYFQTQRNAKQHLYYKTCHGEMF